MTHSANYGLDRRTVLRGAALVSALAAAPGLARASLISRSPVRFVVVDERISESKAFGAALRREGVQRLEVSAGLTTIWQNHLYPHWQGSQGAVIGLTTRNIWDGLSQQAHGQFRKARLVGIHQIGGAVERCQHAIETPFGANIARPDFASNTGQWPKELARMLAQYSPGTNCARKSRLYGASIPANDLRQQLVSWIIE